MNVRSSMCAKDHMNRSRVHVAVVPEKILKLFDCFSIVRDAFAIDPCFQHDCTRSRSSGSQSGGRYELVRVHECIRRTL